MGFEKGVGQRAPDAVAPPAGNPRFPAVDGLRALAALGVIAYHADQYAAAAKSPLGHIADHLDLGVAIFFAITGFLLYRPFLAAAVGDAPRVGTRMFYWRRIVRILPAYWVALLVLAPAISYARPAGLPNILFLQTYKPGWFRSGIGPAWSVCVEISFYALLPCFVAALNRLWGHLDREARCRRELIVILFLAAATMALRLIVAHFVSNKKWLDPLPTTLPWFCVGMTLAVISVQRGRIHELLSRHPWWCWTLAAALFASEIPTYTLSVDSASETFFIRNGLIAGLVLAPLVTAKHFAPARVAERGVLAWLGLISYGIYLYHDPIMSHISFSGSPTARLLLDGGVGAVAAIACGAASYYLIERYALRLKRGLPARSGDRKLGIDLAVRSRRAVHRTPT